MSRVPRPTPVSSPPPEEIEDDVEEDDDEMGDFDGDMMDPMEMLGNFLATDDGETIAMTLVSLKDATEKIALNMEMQNKILVKMLTAMNKTGSVCACRSAPESA
jgi:hypothetical protein